MLAYDQTPREKSAEWLLRVTRDRSDVGYQAGAVIVADHGHPPNDEAIVVIHGGDRLALAQQPVEGEILGFVIGRVASDEIQDGGENDV